MPTKDEEAMALAQKHYELEAGLTQIFRITGIAELELRPVEPIKLLEVNENTVPSGIMPIQFGPPRPRASTIHRSSWKLHRTNSRGSKTRN